MQRKLYFCLSPEIKMPRNAIWTKKAVKLKWQQNFHDEKCSCNKVNHHQDHLFPSSKFHICLETKFKTIDLLSPYLSLSVMFPANCTSQSLTEKKRIRKIKLKMFVKKAVVVIRYFLRSYWLKTGLGLAYPLWNNF